MSYLYVVPIIMILLYYIRKYFDGSLTPCYPKVKGKIILITGASAGIGKDTAIELLRHGAIVIFACRDEKKTLNIINSLDKESKENSIFIRLNLSSLKSINEFEGELEKKGIDKIDIIINNAAYFATEFNHTEDGIEETFQVNLLSHYYLTSKLIKYLNQEGRVINLSSGVHKLIKSIDFNELESNDLSRKFESFKNLALSKLGIIYFSNTLSKYFESENLKLKSVSMNPGAVISSEGFNKKGVFFLIFRIFLKTIGWFFFKSPFKGIQTTLHLCYLDFNLLINGAYYEDFIPSKISEIAKNDNTRKTFMNYCCNLLRNKGELNKILTEMNKD